MTQPAAVQPNIIRQCGVCGQFDDHPHHTWAPWIEDGVVREPSYHMDCCQAQGCPDGKCDAVMSTAGSKRGEDLRQHIVSGGADAALAKLLEARA